MDDLGSNSPIFKVLRLFKVGFPTMATFVYMTVTDYKALTAGLSALSSSIIYVDCVPDRNSIVPL
jgi:hypothetical protein